MSPRRPREHGAGERWGNEIDGRPGVPTSGRRRPGVFALGRVGSCWFHDRRHRHLPIVHLGQPKVRRLAGRHHRSMRRANDRSSDGPTNLARGASDGASRDAPLADPCGVDRRTRRRAHPFGLGSATTTRLRGAPEPLPSRGQLCTLQASAPLLMRRCAGPPHRFTRQEGPHTYCTVPGRLARASRPGSTVTDNARPKT